MIKIPISSPYWKTISQQPFNKTSKYSVLSLRNINLRLPETNKKVLIYISHKGRLPQHITLLLGTLLKSSDHHLKLTKFTMECL